MCINRLGSVEISPKKLLLDGFRRELKAKLVAILEMAQPTNISLLKFLNAQTQKMTSFREAFVFVCEHLGINGIQLWQSQLQSVMNVALEIEKSHLKHQVA